MASGKKSFVLYSDQRTVIDLLSDEQAGKLLKHIFSYVNDESPELKDLSLQLAFEPIKQQLKRDLQKWENQRKQRSEAGKKSAQSRKRNLTSVNEKKRNSTVNVNDNVNVTVNVTDINIPAYEDFLKYAVSKKPKLNPDELKLKYESWVENNWKDGNDKPIKNWKTKILNTLPYISETTKTVNTNPTINRSDFFTD